jgi:hypothetical protein
MPAKKKPSRKIDHPQTPRKTSKKSAGSTKSKTKSKTNRKTAGFWSTTSSAKAKTTVKAKTKREAGLFGSCWSGTGIYLRRGAKIINTAALELAQLIRDNPNCIENKAEMRQIFANAYDTLSKQATALLTAANSPAAQAARTPPPRVQDIPLSSEPVAPDAPLGGHNYGYASRSGGYEPVLLYTAGPVPHYHQGYLNHKTGKISSHLH